MTKNRMEAFSDGVIAIIITIMVLELKVPLGSDWEALRPLLPVFGSYVMSFIYVGIYWNNHHHLMHATQRVTGSILWANLHLLFWLSLVPFVTGWMSENHFDELPTALYGCVLLCAGLAYLILQTRLIAVQKDDKRLRSVIGQDIKGKLSLALYLLAIPLAFWNSFAALAIYVAVAILWVVPDRRIETGLASDKGD